MFSLLNLFTIAFRFVWSPLSSCNGVVEQNLELLHLENLEIGLGSSKPPRAHHCVDY